MRQRSLRSWIAGALFVAITLAGLVLGLSAGGSDNIIWGVFQGVVTGNIASQIVLKFEKIPLRAWIGGLVGAVLGGLQHVLIAPAPVQLLPLVAMVFAGSVVGALLALPPWRFPVIGALLGGIPMPLVGLIFFLIAPHSRGLAMMVAVSCAGAFLLAGVGWAGERSLDNVWRWALAGALVGLIFTGLVQLRVSFKAPASTSPPPTFDEMMLTLKMLVGIGVFSGALLGAFAGLITHLGLPFTSSDARSKRRDEA